MSRWTVSYENQQNLKKIQETLTTLESIKVEGLSASDLEEYSRLLKVMKLLAVRFSALDAELYPLSTWGNFPSWVNNIQANVTNFLGNRNVVHLQQANNTADSVLGAVRPLDTPSTLEETKAATKAGGDLQRKIVEELRARVNEARKQLDAFSKEIELTRSRLEENNQTIQQQKARLDESISEFQKQFSTAQDTRGKDFVATTKTFTDEFAKKIESFSQRFKEATDQRKKEHDQLTKSLEEQSSAHLTFLKQREDEVNKIFGAIGTSALAGNFKKTADEDAISANRWRITAVTLMAFIAGVALTAFILSIIYPVDWETFLFRMGTCLFLAVPAFYAANESSKHRERERLNRKIHLELAAIDAYLALLPDAQRYELKGKLTEKFFGVPDVKEKTEVVSKKDLFGLVATAVGNLTKGK